MQEIEILQFVFEGRPKQGYVLLIAQKAIVIIQFLA